MQETFIPEPLQKNGGSPERHIKLGIVTVILFLVFLTFFGIGLHASLHPTLFSKPAHIKILDFPSFFIPSMYMKFFYWMSTQFSLLCAIICFLSAMECFFGPSPITVAFLHKAYTRLTFIMVFMLVACLVGYLLIIKPQITTPPQLPLPTPTSSPVPNSNVPPQAPEESQSSSMRGWLDCFAGRVEIGVKPHI